MTSLLRRVVAVPGAVVGTGLELLRAAEQIPAVVTRLRAVLGQIEMLVRRVDLISAQAARTVDEVGVTRAGAEADVRGAREIELRIRALIDRCEPLLGAVVDVDPSLVRTLADLGARLEPLLDQFDTTLMPLLGEMHEAIPDVRDLLPVVQRIEPVMVDVETRIAGLPGSARLRRRGEQVIEQVIEENESDDT